MSSGARGQALRLMAAPLLQASWCALAAASALAEEPTPGAWLKRWTAELTMAGNWLGVRDVLNGWGIKPRVFYATDLMASVAGGQHRGQAYAGELTVEIDTDLGKVAGLRGLRFDVSGNWSSDSDLSLDIGNTFTVAQYFEGRELRLTNMFLQQSLLEGRLDLKAGRFSTGNDFLTSPIDVSFVNEALNPIILAVQRNVPGVTAEPNATWGGRVVVQPTPTFSISTGAFYSDPTLNQLTANGTEFGISSSAGYFLVTEATFLVHAENKAPGMPGRYRLGAYYDSNQYASFSRPGVEQTGNYGLYVMGEQMVFREGGPGSAKGLTLFGAIVYAPSRASTRCPCSCPPERAIAALFPRGTGTPRPSRSTMEASAAICRG